MIVMDEFKDVHMTYDESLNRFESIILAPEKVKEAEETLERMGLPDFE